MLQLALETSSVEIVELLLKNTPNIDYLNENNNVPILFRLIDEGKPHLLSLLVKYGANMFVRHPHTNQSILQYAADKSAPEVIFELLNLCPEMSDDFIFHFNKNLLTDLIEKYQKVNQETEQMIDLYCAPLYAALYLGANLHFHSLPLTQTPTNKAHIHLSVKKNHFIVKYFEPTLAKMIVLNKKIDEALHSPFIFTLPTFGRARFKIDKNLHLSIESLEDNASLKVNNFPHCIMTNVNILGAIDFGNLQASSVTLQNVQAHSLKGSLKKLINRGHTITKNIDLRLYAGSEQTAIGLDNTKGVLWATKKLALKANHIVNFQGKLQGGELDIDVLEDLNNIKGKVIFDEQALIRLGGQLNNNGGLISVLTNHLLKIEAGDSIYNQNNGLINSEGTVLLNTKKRLLSDDTSVIHGKVETKIMTNRILQETPLSGYKTSLEVNKIEYMGALISKQETLLQKNTNGLKITSPLISRGLTQVNAPNYISNTSGILGDKVILKATRVYGANSLIINAGFIRSYKDNILLNADKLSHSMGNIQSGKDIEFEGSDLKLLSPIYAVRSFYNKNVLNSFEYKENCLQISGTFLAVLMNGMDFNISFTNRGSIYLELSNNATRGFHFNANVICGNNIGDAKNLSRGDFSIKSKMHPIVIGNFANKSFIKFSATGGVYLAIKELDIEYGSIVGIKGIKTCSENKVTVGRLPINKDKPDLPSALGSVGEIFIQTQKGDIILNGCEVRGRSLQAKSPGLVDSIATDINIHGDALLDVPNFTHRLLFNSRGNYRIPWAAGNVHASYKQVHKFEFATTKPAMMNVDGQLHCTGKIEVLGSQLVVKSYTGETPTLTSFIPMISGESRYLGGHRKIEKSKWYPASFNEPTGETYKATFTSGNALSMGTKIFDIAGTIIAPAITLQCSMGTVGIFSHSIKLPTIAPFKRVYWASDYSKPSSFRKIASSSYPSFFQSILSRNIPFPLIEPVIVTSKGVFKDNVQKLRFLYDTQEELDILSGMLIEARGFIFENPQQTLLSLLNNYRANAQEYARGKPREARGASTTLLLSPLVERPDILVPLWVYKEIPVENKDTQETEFVLVPELIIPKSWDNPKLRSGAGYVLAIDGNVIFDGIDENISILRISGYVEAKHGKVGISNFKCVGVEKQLFLQQEQVEEQHTTKRYGHKSTKRTTRTLTRKTPQPGGEIAANRIEVDRVGTFITKGAALAAGAGGVGINLNEKIDSTPIYPSTTQQSTSGAFNRLNGSSSTTYQEVHSIAPSIIRSVGPVDIRAPHISLNGSETTAQAPISITSTTSTGHMELGASTVTNTLPPVHSKKGLTYSVTTGTTQQGLACKFHSTDEIVITSENTLHAVAPALMGKHVQVLSGKTAIIDEVNLQHETQTQTKGWQGFKTIKQNIHQHSETVKTSTFIAFDSISMVSKEGNLILVATKMIVGTGDIRLKAPQGELIFKPAIMNHNMTIEEFSLGLKFFGSNSLEAAMKGHFKEAAKNLLNEFPLLSSMEDLLKSKDNADKICSGLQTVYHAYRLYEAYGKAENIWDTLQAQVNFNPTVRLGKSTSHLRYTTAMLTWLQARNIVMQANSIHAEGVSGECNTLIAEAEKNINIDAGQTTSSQQSTQQGISLGLDLSKGGLPILGVDYAKEGSRAVNYLTSHFKVHNQTTLIAGDQINLRGVCIETLKAVLIAEELTLQTLQDEYKQKSFAAHASTGGSFGLQMGRDESKFAREQSGIIAQETLLINIRKKINLLGAKLMVGDQAKPLSVRYPDGKKTNMYESEMPTDNNDCGFYSLGIT